MVTFNISFKNLKINLAILFFIITNSCLATTYETKTLSFNTNSIEILEGRELKFYSVQIGQHSGKEDLLIEGQIENQKNSDIISPLIVVSLVRTILNRYLSLIMTKLQHFYVEN